MLQGIIPECLTILLSKPLSSRHDAAVEGAVGKCDALEALI